MCEKQKAPDLSVGGSPKLTPQRQPLASSRIPQPCAAVKSPPHPYLIIGRYSVINGKITMKLSHNCRIKKYPDGSVDIVASRRAFGGGEVQRPAPHDDEPWFIPWSEYVPPEERKEREYALLERQAIAADGGDPLAEARAQRSRERATRRARVAVRDLGLCNEWAYFVTLTLDRRRIDRYDAAEVVHHLNGWLDNRVRRDGLAYVLVPERHKDGAIHFHGFFNAALPVVDSGHKDSGGHAVYNLPAWGWGFSTAIALYGDRAAAVGYCCKYVAKQQEKIGGRWYYSGGELRRPDVEWTDVDFDELCTVDGAQPFAIDGLPHSEFVRLRLTSQEACDVKQEPCKSGSI